MLYREGEFPMGAICPVAFAWRPLAADDRTDGAFQLCADWESVKRQLWLWIHPAAYMEAATAISKACQAVMTSDDRYRFPIRYLVGVWLN